MRRAIVALVGTAAGTVLLVGAKASFGGPTEPQTKPLANNPAAGRSAGSATPATPPGSTPGTPGNAATNAPTNPGKTTASAPRPTTQAPKGNGLRDGTHSGSYAFAGTYGEVEVSIVVSGGKIAKVNLLTAPDSSARSVELSKRVHSRMSAQAVQRNSASVDSVSGATFTSGAYKDSLQAAVDRARGA